MPNIAVPAAGRGFLRSVSRSAWSSLLALGVTACTDDATSICERLAECKLLPDNYSKGSCERELAREDELASCRDCVEETACKNIVEECRDECLLD